MSTANTSGAISVHNSATELELTEAGLLALGLEQLVFHSGDGGALPYCQFVNGADLPGRPALLVFLHGAGSVGDDNWRQARIPGPPIVGFLKRHQVKAVVLFPQCAAGKQWVDVPWDSLSHRMPEHPSEHMGRALELLDSKLGEFQPDPRRLYVGGISMGGYGAWDMASRRPGLFAAALPICGGADTTLAPALKDLPVYTLHGELDGAVPVSRARDMVAALRTAGNRSVTYVELPGTGHNAWDPAFADERALDWLFSQKRAPLAASTTPRSH